MHAVDDGVVENAPVGLATTGVPKLSMASTAPD
jgi:hypothetical protein